MLKGIRVGVSRLQMATSEYPLITRIEMHTHEPTPRCLHNRHKKTCTYCLRRGSGKCPRASDVFLSAGAGTVCHSYDHIFAALMFNPSVIVLGGDITGNDRSHKRIILLSAAHARGYKVDVEYLIEENLRISYMGIDPDVVAWHLAYGQPPIAIPLYARGADDVITSR